MEIHIHLHTGMQAAQAEDLGEQEERDKETRLERVFANGGTLTPEEFEWLRRRGRIHY